jgi:hypothetical protein
MTTRSMAARKVASSSLGRTARESVDAPRPLALFRRLVNDAVRRDPAALKLLLPLIDRYAASPETELRLGELLAEDQAILSQYLSRPAGYDSGWARESQTDGLGDGI